MKLLLGRALMDRKDDKEEIMLELDEIKAQLQAPGPQDEPPCKETQWDWISQPSAWMMFEQL
jgi:hypothetical protein